MFCVLCGTLENVTVSYVFKYSLYLKPKGVVATMNYFIGFLAQKKKKFVFVPFILVSFPVNNAQQEHMISSRDQVYLHSAQERNHYILVQTAVWHPPDWEETEILRVLLKRGAREILSVMLSYTSTKPNTRLP